MVLLGNGFIRQIGIDGSNPRDLFDGTVAIGLGHGLGYPDLVWDNDGDVPAFRVLLFPSYDPNSTAVFRSSTRSFPQWPEAA